MLMEGILRFMNQMIEKPKDTNNVIYIKNQNGNETINSLFAKCQDKWGEDICMDTLYVNCEPFLDEWRNWVEYFVITRKK